MKIALTFDDGPHPRYTPEILDFLKETGIKATFFVVGENALYYPGVLERIRAEGHEIGNHTFSHAKVMRENQTALKDELEACEKVIYEATDTRPKLFRPPEGAIDEKVRSLAGEMDYEIILWNIDTRDWAHSTPKEISENVEANIAPGSIILMHDFIGKASPTLEALKLFVPKLLEEGYQFVVVSELIGSV